MRLSYAASMLFVFPPLRRHLPQLFTLQFFRVLVTSVCLCFPSCSYFPFIPYRPHFQHFAYHPKSESFPIKEQIPGNR